MLDENSDNSWSGHSVRLLLNNTGARYLVCGAQACILHGLVRTTEDVDILVQATEENCQRVIDALARLEDGAARENTPRDILENVGVKVADEVEVDRGAIAGFTAPGWLAAVFFLLHLFRLSIHRDATDQERGEDVISVIVSEDEDATSGGWNSDVVACRNPQLASVRQMDRERNERRGVCKFPNISNHKE